MKQRLSLIWAMTRNRVIGKDGWLAWDLPDELDHFRSTTAGKPVIMGRKTYQSTNRPMPGRLNIVLSRNRFQAEGVSVVADLDEALRLAAHDPADEVFVIGGTEPFAIALPRADRLYATVIDALIDGDTFFPPFDLAGWKAVENSFHDADERHPYAYEITIYERADNHQAHQQAQQRDPA